jgi:adenylosuccinate lyase
MRSAPATTVLDSVLFRDAFGTPAMREVFSDHALVGRYVEIEIALAKAEAKCGVIPVEAAEAIAKLDVSLQEALQSDPKVTARIDRATLERLTSPRNYLGLAPQMVDRVLASPTRQA